MHTLRLGEGVVTQANFNNEIGVPLTLLGLRERHRFGVIEMGARVPATSPISAVWCVGRGGGDNAAPAHLEGFGDIVGVARQGEIFANLGEQGVAVINETMHASACGA